MDSAAMAAVPDLDGPALDDKPVPAATKPAENALDRLKEKRRKVRRAREPLKLDIPDYDGDLVAAYRVLDWPEMKALREKGNAMAATNDPGAELKVTADTIAAACVGFYGQGREGLVPLNELKEEYGDEPVIYDDRLADALGIETKSVRTLIFEMFPTDLSIIAHLAEISRWMESSRSEDDEDF